MNAIQKRAERQAAHHDLMHVYAQLKAHNPPFAWPVADDARVLVQLTRDLITWAQERGIEISLPDGWEG